MSAPTVDRDTDRYARAWDSVRGWAGSLRRRTKDWLDRPMTSFHLVVAVFVLLLGFGLLMVLSSSSVTAYRKDGSSFSVFKKQLIFAGIGLIGFYVMMRVRVNWLRAWSTTGLIACIGLLVVVLGMPKVNGARSWIFVGPLSFQPSEVAKFALVIWGAHVLASRHNNLGSWRQLYVPVLPVAMLIGGLVFLEPDLGMTATIAVIVLALFFFAGASWKLFATMAGVGVTGLAVLALSSGYRQARVISFLNPEANPQGSGLQLLQGLYGMGDGGLFGVGLGQSRAKWAYLPHAESDFIFAIIGEELGLIGATLVVLLYVTLALVGLRIARRNVDPFIKLVSATATAWLVGQAAINIFYVVGLLPVTGLTLPMISAGGTSLVVTMAIFGLLANFARREPQAMAALQDSGPGPISRFLGVGVPGSAEDEARKTAVREERRQNRAWARSARKSADDRRAVRTAARQRPTDPRDERPAGGPIDRTAAGPSLPDRAGPRLRGPLLPDRAAATGCRRATSNSVRCGCADRPRNRRRCRGRARRSTRGRRPGGG